MFARRFASRVLMLRQVPAERLEAPQARRELLAAAAEALAAALDQELQVVARVAVERREDLVGLHVRLGLGERDRSPSSTVSPDSPGSTSIVMS